MHADSIPDMQFRVRETVVKIKISSDCCVQKGFNARYSRLEWFVHRQDDPAGKFTLGTGKFIKLFRPEGLTSKPWKKSRPRAAFRGA
ncbi:hypothetical protein QTH90_12245 [Variovorax sp. J2P1-59]|uniref:hypothetical protein n=1 Tax=Variovorax flavidus TaxID=3053501 RepID=UPI002576D6F5|nr:hypothetical protein [Variovorax sp. J2P1-59]MDM0075159.1 hypothetical protein [Variovorax sp. J2P1-59]